MKFIIYYKNNKLFYQITKITIVIKAKESSVFLKGLNIGNS